MGAGGVGSYLGAMLARAGADVTLVCRGRHLAAIRAQGLGVLRIGDAYHRDILGTAVGSRRKFLNAREHLLAAFWRRADASSVGP